MTTSNFEPDKYTDTVDLANALPDVTLMVKLANEMFSALPCDGTGSGFGLLSNAAFNAGYEQVSSIDKAYLPGTSPNHYGLPGEAELQKLFAPRSTSAGSFPSAKLAGSHPDEALSALLPPQPVADKSLFTGINTQGFDLPGEAELKRLLAQRTIVQSPSSPASSPNFKAEAPTANSFYFLDDNVLLNRDPHTQGLNFAHPAFDVTSVRRDFPILNERVNGHQLVWFDNAATTQKPQVVIDRVSHFYEHENSNIHRAAHELAARSTDAYEKARNTVARFINASSSNDIVFVRGTTEGINLVAQSWGRQYIHEGDEIVISWLEHHANIVPWQQLCSETGAVLRVIPVDDDGQVLLNEYQKLLTSKTKLVSFTQVSNALGTVTPAQQMIEMAHRVGAKVLLDGAQSVSHLRADVQALDCDWFVFSGHKIFGPTGIGALYGKPELLEAMPPWQGGGNMIEDVTFEKTIYQPAPARFEAGTGNIADAVGLGAALEYVENLGIDNIARYEHELLVYAMDKLKSIPGLRLIGTAPDKTSVLSFVLAGHSNQDVGVALNKVGIAVRTGHHCAQPILRRFGLESTVRPSLAFYNTYDEVDHLVTTVRRIQGGNVII
jgi:cysteine desulfurase/selenocysteine lyase